MPTSSLDDFGTITTLAREWCLGLDEICAAVESGELPAVKTELAESGGWILRRADLRCWLERATAPASRSA